MESSRNWVVSWHSDNLHRARARLCNHYYCLNLALSQGHIDSTEPLPLFQNIHRFCSCFPLWNRNEPNNQSIDMISECPKPQSMCLRTDFSNPHTPTINRLISQTPRAQTIKWVDFSKPEPKHPIDFAAGQERGGGGDLNKFSDSQVFNLSVGMPEYPSQWK